MTKKICMLYGLGEGPEIAGKFIASANKQGFVFSNNINKADIIFAHSGGCYLVPVNTKANLIVLNGLPYYPDESILKSVVQKVKYDYFQKKRSNDIGYWLYKTIWNSYYMLRHPVKGYYMFKGWKNKTLPDGSDRRIIVIRNKYDPFSTADYCRQLARDYKWQFEEMPGAHDEVWDDPAPYVEIINKASIKFSNG